MTTDLKTLAAKIENRADVYSAKIWNDRRVYVNLVGVDRSFAGDRNLKVFYDTKVGWVIDGLKGTQSSKLADSLSTFKTSVVEA